MDNEDPASGDGAVEVDDYTRTLTDSDYERLGRYVREARRLLGLTQAAVAEQGGPSVATQRQIESGKPAHYRWQTFEPLERVLMWPRGAFNGALRLRIDPNEDLRALQRQAPPAPRPTVTDLSWISDSQLIAELARRLGEREPLAQLAMANRVQNWPVDETTESGEDGGRRDEEAAPMNQAADGRDDSDGSGADGESEDRGGPPVPGEPQDGVTGTGRPRRRKSSREA